MKVNVCTEFIFSFILLNKIFLRGYSKFQNYFQQKKREIETFSSIHQMQISLCNR